MPIPDTMICVEESERQALALIQARYGLATLSDALRLALRTLASGKFAGARERVLLEGHTWVFLGDFLVDRDGVDEQAIQAEIASTTKAELQQSRAELAET